MYQHPKYPILFSPLKVNRLVLKNRIFYAPVEYYHDRALSGCAVMMRGTSGTLNDPRCRVAPGKWIFADGEMEKAKDELALIRRNGALTSLEIMHAGMAAMVPPGEYVVGPCDTIREDGVEVKGLDKDGMEQIIREFVETAVIAKKIGYDMVMIHFAHGWLPSQFFAPGINHRTDEFGGSFENRVRFPKMILRAIRKALGKGYPIDMRISAYENFDGCMSAQETIRFIKEVAEEGLIDMVNVSYGGHMGGDPESRFSPSAFAPDMTFADWAKPIKEAVSIPVAVVGKIMTPDEAEEILRDGKADAVVIGRASIADPYWAQKAFEGRPEDIRPCIACGKCFSKRCPINIRGYQEALTPLHPPKAATPEKVVVVGGGPAGMKAALTAAEMGHKVVLFEATDSLGGLIRTADHDENKRELKRYKDYLLCQVKKSGIEVRLNQKATPELVAAEKPDRLILAMGSVPVTPPIKGVERAIQAVDAHEQIDSLGKKIVLIGGGLVGSEFAVTLSRRGHQVTVVEMTGVVGAQNEKILCPPYDLMVRDKNITMLPYTQCSEIREGSVTVVDRDSREQILEADTVILSAGFRSNNDDLAGFYGITPHTSAIGDLRRPATIRECETEGFFALADV